MADTTIVLPSKPKIIKEVGNVGTYEIDGLYPGYGHTLGNSLRRVILSSLEGSAITSIKIKGVGHEFSALDGVKDDVIMTILNLKKLRFHLLTDEAQTLKLSVKGPAIATGADIKLPAQVEIMNPEQYINEVTDKNTTLEIEIVVEKGLGYMPKEMTQKERVDIGTIAMDAIFSPARRVSYEVENMRVGNRTDFNRVRLTIETDGTLTPKEALEYSIRVMIDQLKAIVGFEEKEEAAVEAEVVEDSKDDSLKELDVEFLKTRIDSIGLSPRTVKSLSAANIRTIGGLARKKEADILEIDGLGSKGMQEIKKVLSGYGITLK